MGEAPFVQVSAPVTGYWRFYRPGLDVDPVGASCPLPHALDKSQLCWGSSDLEGGQAAGTGIYIWWLWPDFSSSCRIGGLGV